MQTAVDWLVNELRKYDIGNVSLMEWKVLNELSEQAKQMEKQQIKANDFFVDYETIKQNNMTLIEHAKMELQMVGAFDKESNYEGEIGKAVMELIEVFANQGHSGNSASIVRTIFNKLANYEPLMGITGEDKEWGDVMDFGDGKQWYQNKRCSALFKDGIDGKPYYIDAIVKRDQKGVTWSGDAWLSEEDYKSGDRSKMVGKRGYIKSFPFKPKTFVIDVKDVEVAKDDWESFIVNPSQLDEVWEYYDKY